jgi:hypothetical protein
MVGYEKGLAPVVVQSQINPFSYRLEWQVIDLELYHQRKGDLTQGICKWGPSQKALRKKCNHLYYFKHTIKCRFGIYWFSTAPEHIV